MFKRFKKDSKFKFFFAIFCQKFSATSSVCYFIWPQLSNFSFNYSFIMSSAKCDCPAVYEIEKKKPIDDQQDVKVEQLKWNQVLPEKVKHLFWIIKENFSKFVCFF